MTTATEPGTRSTFFTDARMNSMTRAMLGRVYTGAADTGEALTTIDRVTDGDYASWAREWEATAGRVEAIGDDCLRRGHRVSGRNALLRAATYYMACVVVADGCDDPETVIARTFAMHMHVEGNGSPTVVLDAGAGGLGLSWDLVRPVLAKVTRVVVYDRAGLGWSDPSPYPRDAYTMAVELHTMLTNANITGPYILAGHSLGGVVARQFAAKYPGEVAGLVMVDSAHEQQIRHFPEPIVKMIDSMKGMMGIMKWMSKLGVFALRPDLISIGDNGKLGKELTAQMRAVMAASDSHAEALIAETVQVYSAQTRAVSTLGDLPLTVISHGQLDANAIPASLGQQVREDYERAWQELQGELTSLSTRGRRIVAESSGHNILYDQPEIVIESILDLIRFSRRPVEMELVEYSSGVTQ